jgi:hypothetical protein
MMEESFSCCEKADWRRNNCDDSKISRIMAVKTVTLGRGSEAKVGRKSQ